MSCEKDFTLRMKVLYLDKEDLLGHVEECPVCERSLDRAYDLYISDKKDPILKSFPCFDPKKSREEFLRDWRLSLASKKERFDHYKKELKGKMNETGMKSLILELVSELIRVLEVDNEKDRLARVKALNEIIEIIDGELLKEEFEMFFGFSKEKVIQIINSHLREDEKKKLPRP